MPIKSDFGMYFFKKSYKIAFSDNFFQKFRKNRIFGSKGALGPGAKGPWAKGPWVPKAHGFQRPVGPKGP